MLIQQINEKQAEDIFNLYKKIVETDFKEWTAESKHQWLTNQYSLNFWVDLLKSNLPIYVIFDNKEMVGYVAIESLTFGVAYLGWLGVLTEYRSKGLGAKLIGEIEKWCANNNIHKIELETQIKELLPFFEKLGYTLEGTRKNSWQHLNNYMLGKTLK